MLMKPGARSDQRARLEPSTLWGLALLTPSVLWSIIGRDGRATIRVERHKSRPEIHLADPARGLQLR